MGFPIDSLDMGISLILYTQQNPEDCRRQEWKFVDGSTPMQHHWKGPGPISPPMSCHQMKRLFEQFHTEFTQRGNIPNAIQVSFQQICIYTYTYIIYVTVCSAPVYISTNSRPPTTDDVSVFVRKSLPLDCLV